MHSTVKYFLTIGKRCLNPSHCVAQDRYIDAVCRRGPQLDPKPSHSKPNCSLQKQSRAQDNIQAAWINRKFGFTAELKSKLT